MPKTPDPTVLHNVGTLGEIFHETLIVADFLYLRLRDQWQNAAIWPSGHAVRRLLTVILHANFVSGLEMQNEGESPTAK